MGSSFILRVRICVKPIRPFLTPNTLALCKSSQLPLSGRFLCTRDSNYNSGDRRNNGQGAVKYGTSRRRVDEFAVKRSGTISTLRQKPLYPKSVFVAGTAKRTAEMMKMKAPLVSKDEEPEEGTTRRKERMQPPDRPLSVAEWKTLKESQENPGDFESRMMSALSSSSAELDIIKSLLTFVAMETGTLSYKLMLFYLRLCVYRGHNDEVFEIYEIMRQSFSLMETGATSLFIKSFCQTARWREALSLLDEAKKILTPSAHNYGHIISAAASHGDTATAWALYDELIEKGLSPYQEVWADLFKGDMKTKEHRERLLQILLYMRNNQIYPQHSLASTIKTWFESFTEQQWTGSWTHVSPGGKCTCCGSKLESIQLTAEEYQQLKDRVMTDIIQGEDVFKKTTPKELQRFKEFVKKKPAFDVVVDGLNVANYNYNKHKLSETLLTVVSELERQGRNVLVLGREHMLNSSRSWQRHHMDLIQRKAHCFFIENTSEDDPFLLYATLHSGNHCRFVSRDLMRDHKACLKDIATRQLFFKWQRGNQLVVDGSVKTAKRVYFKDTLSFDTTIQTSADSWHLPYDDTEDRSSYEVPQRWLCLTRKH